MRLTSKVRDMLNKKHDGLNRKVTMSPTGNTYMFQGRRLDSETENYYYRNRYYPLFL